MQVRTRVALLLRSLNTAGWSGTGVLLFVAFLLRIVMRLVRGEQDFWTNSYSSYYELGLRLVTGHGLCFDDSPAATCAWWPPVYPALMAAAALTPRPYLTIVAAQSFLGAITVFCAIKLGERLLIRVMREAST